MENDHQKKTEEIQVTIKKIEKELEELRSEELSGHLEPLVAFYDWARGYLNLRNEYWVRIHEFQTSRCFLFFFRITL